MCLCSGRERDKEIGVDGDRKGIKRKEHWAQLRANRILSIGVREEGATGILFDDIIA